MLEGGIRADRLVEAGYVFSPKFGGEQDDEGNWVPEWGIWEHPDHSYPTLTGDRGEGVINAKEDLGILENLGLRPDWTWT